MSGKNKLNKLKALLADCGTAVIAFFGGLDSSLLSHLAFGLLKDNVLAVTAVSPAYPKQDLKCTKQVARRIGIKHLIINSNEFNDKRFTANKKDRCYWCKRELFSRLKKICLRRKFDCILDGTNYDDRFDLRPGMRANREFAVISPFYECKFTKKDIRNLARSSGLSFWDKPSGACLSSRIPFGQKLTVEKINRVAKAEDIIKPVFGPAVLFRARDHGDILRIEAENREWTKFNNSDITNIIKKLKKLGYKYVVFDCEGYIPAGKRS